MDLTAVKTGSRRGTVLAGTVAATTTGALFVFARIVTRSMIVGNVGWDDGLVLLAWVYQRTSLQDSHLLLTSRRPWPLAYPSPFVTGPRKELGHIRR